MSSPVLTLIAAAALAWGACLHAEPLPLHLRDTGLYADGSGTQIDLRNLAFSPQYPLWSDGAHKRRWIYLPPGAAIDASRPDAWEFPPGTRLWKEFSLDRPVETRFIERLPDGAWRYAVYVWNEEGTDATLAPADGIAALAAHGAPRDGYSIPSEFDCRACHESAAVPVLGFSALQLSSDRDPLAPHADARTDIDLDGLVARGLIKNLPPGTRPRIDAISPIERATLGYLHGNCGHCHNDNDTRVPVDLTLAQSVATGPDRVLRSLINVRSRFIARVSSRDPQRQMPPIGTRLIDTAALALIERWIAEKSPTPEELKP